MSLLPVLRRVEHSDGECKGIIIFWFGYHSQANTIVLDKVGFVRSHIRSCDVVKIWYSVSTFKGEVACYATR